jgi:hypothetical protein
MVQLNAELAMSRKRESERERQTEARFAQMENQLEHITMETNAHTQRIEEKFDGIQGMLQSILYATQGNPQP